MKYKHLQGDLARVIISDHFVSRYVRLHNPVPKSFYKTLSSNALWQSAILNCSSSGSQQFILIGKVSIITPVYKELWELRREVLSTENQGIVSDTSFSVILFKIATVSERYNNPSSFLLFLTFLNIVHSLEVWTSIRFTK